MTAQLDVGHFSNSQADSMVWRKRARSVKPLFCNGFLLQMAKVELRGDRLTPPLLSPTPMVDNTAWIIHEPSVCPKGWAGAAAAEALAPPRVRHPQTKHFRGFSTA